MDGPLEIFQKQEVFRKYISSLDMVAAKYNSTLNSILDVERPLLKVYIQEIDSVISTGLLVCLLCVVVAMVQHQIN